MPGQSLSSDFLTGYDLVLTPNLRTARQLETLQPAGTAANILPWRAWTASLWERLILAGKEDRVLLNEAQTAALWEQVLADVGPVVLRPVRSIVELCISAQRLVCDYGALPTLLDYAGESESDAGAFTAWLQEFERRCRRDRYITPATLNFYAAQALRSRETASFQEMRCLLFGFDPLQPSQTALIEALQYAGAAITWSSAADLADRLRPKPDHPTLLTCDHAQAEFEHLAQALKTFLDDGVRSISVVVPNLADTRGKIERELRTVFLPEGWTAPDDGQRPLWEFSEGLPLASVSLVRDALILLEWLQKPQLPEHLSQLLRSPYFDLGVGLEEAADLDTRILRDRERIRPEWSLLALVRRVENRAPNLRDSLGALEQQKPDLRSQRSYSDWLETARVVLNTAGWPGARERSSYEYQAVDRWNDLLDQVTSLDAVAKPLSYCEFLHRLKQLASETVFSPQNTGAPIQLLSPSESEGTTAEVLWLACAEGEHWNSQRQTHPLLAFALQKEFGMPGTDPVRDDEEAYLLTERLVRSAGQVIFSYGAANDSGAIRPSPLVTRISSVLREAVSAHEPIQPRLKLEELLDEEPLPELPDTTVSGGVSILQHQAACAFRAFAERRLFSSELDTVDLGMEPRERGSALHKALQLFWDLTRTQSELHRLIREETLGDEIQRAVHEAIPQLAKEEKWTQAYLAIQRERLVRLLSTWLAYEAERPPFEVLHTEHEVEEVSVGPLRMNMRVDRIDRVDDNGQPATILVDYKTGNPDVKGWLGERPAEPQLPMYATAAGFDNVQAIAFATVKPGKKSLGLKTFPNKSPLLFLGAKEGDGLAFEQQLLTWRETLETLAEDFANGHADVGPKEYPATCQWCAQRMLCRLNPELLDDLAEEDGDGEVAP